MGMDIVSNTTMVLTSHPPNIVTIIPFKGRWDHIGVWILTSFVNVCCHKLCHELVFYKPLPFHFGLGACNVVALSWLASTLTSQCGAPSNPWSQDKTNVLEPHDKTLW
jgi:hypothetical protein